MDILRGHIVAGDSKALYIQRKNKIYKRSQDNERYIFSISMPLWKRILIEIRLCQRLLRTDIRSAIICEGKLFYALSGCLYSYDFCNRKNKRELVFRSGMRAPLSFTSICGIKGCEDQICFGEYFSNNNREEVNIWSNRGGEWNVVYSFPKGSIRHIHGIVGDRYRNCVYVLTGDSDAESAIWKAENGFESVEKLISGDQQSRCCVLQPRKNCLVYATDSEYEQNKIYVVDFKGNGRTERIPIYDLEGSVIYGYVLEEDKMYISTTVERDHCGHKRCV